MNLKMSVVHLCMPPTLIDGFLHVLFRQEDMLFIFVEYGTEARLCLGSDAEVASPTN